MLCAVCCAVCCVCAVCGVCGVLCCLCVLCLVVSLSSLLCVSFPLPAVTFSTSEKSQKKIAICQFKWDFKIGIAEDIFGLLFSKNELVLLFL